MRIMSAGHGHATCNACADYDDDEEAEDFGALTIQFKDSVK